MPRIFGAAAATFFAVSLWATPGGAQAFDPSVARMRPGATIAAAAGPLDDARGRRIAEWAAPGAAAGVDVAWTDGLASGTIRLDATTGGCRAFFVRQTSPAGSSPLVGRVCLSAGKWTVQSIGAAAAAGPRAEPRVTESEIRDAEREVSVPRPKKDVTLGERPSDVKPYREYGASGSGKADSGLGGSSTTMSSSGPPPSPPKPPPPPMAPPPAPEPRVSPPPSPGNATGSGSGVGGGVVRTTSAVLVEIGAREARKPRNGGSAVVLLSTRTEDAARNLRVCRALFRALDTATTGEITTGQRRTEEGGIEKLRPVYWLWKGKAAPPAGDACPVRVASYDFARAGSIRTKYGLTGRGPYLVVARGDELRAGVVDLGAAPIGDTEDLVRYFRDGFSQEDDIWSPERHTPARAQQSLVAFLGRAIPGSALTALVRPVAVASCPLGDFFDVCTPTPR